MPARILRARPVAVAAIVLASALLLIVSSMAVLHYHESHQVDSLRDAAQGKNLVMILLDAGAYAHFGYAGYERATTPVIDKLAHESVVFRTAYSPAASTAHAVYTMLTSSYPFLAEKERLEGKHTGAFRVTETTLLMAELLEPAFPRRTGITANSWFGPDFGLDRGFTHFYETYDRADVPDSTRPHAERTVELFGRDLAQWGDEPSFAYLHFLEPHTPYTPPEEFARRFDPTAMDYVDARSRPLLEYRVQPPDPLTQDRIRALYDANLAYVDAQVGKVFDLLKKHGKWDDTVVVVITDHGEAFWQHGVYGHGRHIYDEFVRIPMLMRVPGLPEFAGCEVDEPVSLVDLFPTFLDLAGLPVPDALRGKSLLPLIAGDADDFEQRPVFLRNTHNDAPEYGLRAGRYKWIWKYGYNRYELYDLVADPLEKHDLVAAFQVPEEAEPLRELIPLWLATETDQIEAVDEIDPKTRERLRAIGYF